MRSKVFHFTTFYLIFEYAFGAVVKDNPFPAVQHLFNDTKHRRVNYKSIATTRYREYFYNLVKNREENGIAFPLTRESNTVKEVIIPSSARPAAPEIEYIIPTFEWNRETNGNLTVTGRISGLRVYLKRPWYSSGQGEQLAVVLAVPTQNFASLSISSSGIPVSTWGTDPTKLSAPLPAGIMITPENFINVKDANKDTNLSAMEKAGSVVNIVAFDVKYDRERKLYYADILLNILTAYYPFVRFALARYQRNSIRKDNTDCCLSPVVVADYIQVPAPRASSLKFESGKNNITVAISGTVPNVDSRQMFFRSKVEFIVEPIEVASTESTHITLGAKPIDIYNYVLTGNDIKNFAFYHSHPFNLPAEYATKPYRVKVLEYEMIIYDPLKPNPNPGGVHFGTMPMKDRLVFADVYEVAP